MREKTIKTLMLLMGLAIAAGLIYIGSVLGAVPKNLTNCAGEVSAPAESPQRVPKMPVSGQLCVYFLDVGQGDAALLISPNGKTMLIDSGESIYYGRVKAFLNALGVSGIDIAVGTHSHSDHIGALPHLTDSFRIGCMITPRCEVRNECSEVLDEKLDQHAIESRAVWCGDSIDWDSDCAVTVLSPVAGCEYSAADANDSALMLRVEYGNTAFIFASDVTVHAEQLSMFHNEKELFKADVLKVSHHGSTSASSQGFIETVDADLAIISVGASNPYGHPDFDILNRLKAAGAAVYRTDERGNIAVFSDGNSISAAFQKPER